MGNGFMKSHNKTKQIKQSKMTNVHVNRQPLHTIDQNLKHDLGNEMMKPTIITKGRGQVNKKITNLHMEVTP